MFPIKLTSFIFVADGDVVILLLLAFPASSTVSLFLANDCSDVVVPTTLLLEFE